MKSEVILNKIIDSNDFTVGGGSASAISGAMAAGMSSMVAKLSLSKDYGFNDEEYREIAIKLDDLAEELLSGANEDTKAYCMIRDAYKLPKSNEKEIKIRKREIEKAGIEAAIVPSSNGLKSKTVYELSKRLKNKSNPSAESDLDIAIQLSELAVKGCILNIEANLSLIKDEKTVNLFKERINSLQI